MIGLQAFERRVGRARDRVGRKILRDFALPASARLAVMNEIVADLGRDHDLVALFWKRFRDQLLAQPVAVSIGRIEQRDAEIECLVHERDRFALGKISPPTGRHRPEAEPHLAHYQVGVLVGAELHKERLTTKATEVTEKNLFLSPCAPWPLWLN